MSREEFLAGLEEALAGEVPASVILGKFKLLQFLTSHEMANGQ